MLVLPPMQVEALVADGCPKVWVVTSDALEQQLAHGEVCALPFHISCFISTTHRPLDLWCTSFCAYSCTLFIIYIQPHFLSKCHGSILHILVHNHQKSAASSFPGNMRSGCINPKPVIIACKGLRQDDLNMGNRVAVFIFLTKLLTRTTLIMESSWNFILPAYKTILIGIFIFTWYSHILFLKIKI